MTDEEILAMAARIEKLEEAVKELQEKVEAGKPMTIDDLHDIYDGMQ